MNRWRVGEDRGSKETDGCPLTVCRAMFKCVSTNTPNTTQTPENTKDNMKYK
jgi:hypothetical protein